MVYVGELYVNLELTSNIGPGISKAKGELNQLKPALRETSVEMDRVSTSTRAMMRPLSDAGPGLVAFGAAGYAAGTIMGDAGESFKVAGTGIMAIGSTSMMARPLIQALSSVLSGEMSGALTNFSKLLGATRTELLLFTGAVGAVAVVSLWAYTKAADEAKKATENKAKALDLATKATDNYNRATQERINLEQKIAGIPAKEADLKEKLIGDELAIRAAEMAQAGLGKGATQLERDTAQFNVDRARRQYKLDWAAYFALPDEKAGYEGQLSTARSEQGMAALQSKSDLTRIYNPTSTVNPNMNPIVQPSVMGVPTGTAITINIPQNAQAGTYKLTNEQLTQLNGV